MTSCPECGSSVPDEARFCGQCGAPAKADDLGLLGVEPEPTERAGVSWEGVPQLWILGALAVLALFGAVWLVSRPSADETGSGSSSEEGEQPEESTSDTRDTTTTDDRAEASTTDTPEDTEAADDIGPVLGREVGWSLWVGTDTRQLQRIDLDTGAIEEYEAVRGQPVLATGGWLLLSQEGRLKAVPIDDVAGQPTHLGGSGLFPNVATVGPDAGTAWILVNDGPVSLVWRLVRLSDAERLDEVPLPRPASWLAAGGDPNIVSAPDGGVFERVGGTFERVADGFVLAANDDYVIVETCSNPLDCELQWLDRDAWEPVDRGWPPELDQKATSVWLSPGGRVLVEQAGVEGLTAFDLDRGVPVELPSGLWVYSHLALSPDERYIATASGNTVVVDLDTGEQFELDFSFMEGGALFVENG